MPIDPPQKTPPPVPPNLSQFEEAAANYRARKAQAENSNPRTPPPSPPTPSLGVVVPVTVREPDKPATELTAAPVGVQPVGYPDGLGSDKSAHSPKPVQSPPTEPISPPATPPMATVVVTVAAPAVPPSGEPTAPVNPVGTVFTPPHAPPPVLSPVNSVTPEPTPAPRLPAAASVSGDPVPPEAAMSPAGGEQGVTSASLQLTLPAAPSGRSGKKGAWKTTPNKPRKTLPPQDKRTHCVSVRLSAAELARLTTDMHAQHKKELAAVLRDAYFIGPRPLVPAVNVEKWGELARPLANLNQIALHLNAGHLPEDFRPLLDKLARQFHVFRADLLGQRGAK